MLQLEHIRKAYKMASFTQVALDDVSVAFRDNEFAAILGPSGSGKTTMLNILGGLDHADSGDIIINSVSTKNYSDKDWDAYRNHRIGFIFQSYNLIPHQTILSNVELALTLAGLPASERKERALSALDRVGLLEHASKRPSQLSGGQMQRVAIARALVNDPDIVLADEPTGALDTDTGIQVMELLKEIARDRLVVMVTHNPELAEEYANRIIRLKDGRIVDDTNPIAEGEEDSSGQAASAQGVLPLVGASQAGAAEGAGASRAKASSVSDATRHASMSFLTALALSFNNLMTKKGRTFMTAFAGSIGIIGIAAILALSNGVNDYIAKTEEEALSSYPLTITKSSFDLTGLMLANVADEDDVSDDAAEEEEKEENPRALYQLPIMTDMFAQVKNNDLRSFREFIEGGDSGLEPYVNSIQYGYAIKPQIYKADTSGGIQRLSPSRMSQTLTNGFSGSAFLGGAQMSSFTELLDDQRLLEQSLELVEGRWPESYDECVFVMSSYDGVSDYTLYSLGFYDTKVMDDMTTKALNGETVEVPETYEEFTIDDAMQMHFAVVPSSTLYQKNNEQGSWTDMTGDSDYMRDAIANAIDLHVVGVVRRLSNGSSSAVPEGIGYTSALTYHLMDVAADSDIVRAQRENPDVDVFTGKTFEELQDEENRNFDLSSVFSVDEEALRNAFSFDSSSLEGLGSGVDLSGVDLGSAMSGMDLSGMQLDTSQLTSIFSEDTMRQIMQNAPQFSLSGMGEQPAPGGDTGVQPDDGTDTGEPGTGDDAQTGQTPPADVLTPEQRARLEEAGNQLASGFMAWLTLNGKLVPGEQPDYSALLQEYLATEEAQAIVTPLTSELSTELEKRVNDMMTDYLTNQFAPYLSQAMGTLMTQAAQVMANQLAQQMSAQMAAVSGQIGSQLGNAISSQLQGQMAQLSSALENGFSVDADAFSNAIQFNMTQEDLTSLLTNFMNADELTYDGNMTKLGFGERSNPDSVSIYPKDFEAKEAVLGIVDKYNDDMKAADRDDATIQYSDIAGVLMSSVTDIVNTISLVLIAFVSISLVVSSIMISIITYISVLERKKEIGILRAMGASKLNVANIFNAETVIEGFFAGVLAVAVVYAASVPVNQIIYETRNVPNIMQLPATSALALVGISVVLTLVAGLIPSSAAARRDPVEALRSE